MAIENIFPPIPSEAVLPFAGALSAKGELSFLGRDSGRDRRLAYRSGGSLCYRVLSHAKRVCAG